MNIPWRLHSRWPHWLKGKWLMNVLWRWMTNGRTMTNVWQMTIQWPNTNDRTMTVGWQMIVLWRLYEWRPYWLFGFPNGNFSILEVLDSKSGVTGVLTTCIIIWRLNALEGRGKLIIFITFYWYRIQQIVWGYVL
jgi:hypothetical protein